MCYVPGPPLRSVNVVPGRLCAFEKPFAANWGRPSVVINGDPHRIGKSLIRIFPVTNIHAPTGESRLRKRPGRCRSAQPQCPVYWWCSTKTANSISFRKNWQSVCCKRRSPLSLLVCIVTSPKKPRTPSTTRRKNRWKVRRRSNIMLILRAAIRVKTRSRYGSR